MPNNTVFYPYNSPIILTDDIFVAHGGYTGTSTAAQRTVSFALAEERVSAHLNTLLLPTIVTGTFQLHPVHPVQTDYGYVTRILGVTVYSRDRNSSCTLTSTSSCSYLRDGQRGILDVNVKGSCACSSLILDPYQIEIAYEAGIPSGTSYHPNILTALTIEAQVELNEMGVASINESTGDVGVQSFSNQEYSETRVPLKKTALGTSAISNRAERLLRRYVVYRHVGL